MTNEREDLAARLAASIGELEHQRALVLQLNALKNDLIAVLAHDIKGPLTSIIGFAELLEEGFLEGDAASDAAKTIRTNAQRLATLANDVLELSRVEHGQLEIADDCVNVAELLDGTIESHAGERAIALDRPGTKAIVRGDKARLRQVFDNLIGNALKYSAQDEPVAVTLESETGVWVITVRDRGIGIPAAEVEKVFDRFVRGSNARKAKIPGTGIGLFIVKTIVERHGGTVRATSAAGEGSCFEVRLPAVDSSAETPRRIALVIRNADLRRFVAYELRTRRYSVREAEAVNEIAGDTRRCDVVVVDGDANPEAIRELLGDGSPLRLVGLDGARGDAWDVRLPQPFLVDELLDAIGR